MSRFKVSGSAARRRFNGRAGKTHKYNLARNMRGGIRK